MKTDPKILSTFLAASIWAVGKYDEFEKEFVNDLSEELELATLPEVLDKEIKATEKMSEEALSDHLEEAAKKVAKGEEEGVLTLCLQMMCADAFLAQDEVDNYFAFAEILGVEEETAGTLLIEFVNEEEELIIEE